jgi:putative PIG3 family NAD(P)H quinone oxidoreductase
MMPASIPAEMKHVAMTGPGGPEVLHVAKGPTPQPGKGEVLVKVAAAGVNRPEVLQRKGSYPPPPGVTPILGLEIAGEVVALGEGVQRLKIGDKVCALVSGGGYAEYCPAPEPQCLPIPKPLSLVEAAAVPETFFTVWTNVFERGGLKEGETFLVHGGTSGIGTTAIQLAHAFGARVLATAGSDEKCAFCRKIGAEEAINYRTQDFVAEVKRITEGKGVNLILDMVGGAYIEKNLRSLAMDGRLVQIAFLQPSKVELDLMPVMLKRLTVTGSTLRPRTVEQKGAIAEALRAKVWPLLDAGRVRPIMAKTFKMDEAAEAHRLMESSQHIGKIVLEVA